MSTRQTVMANNVEVMHKDEKTEVKFSTERTPTTEAEPRVSHCTVSNIGAFSFFPMGRICGPCDCGPEIGGLIMWDRTTGNTLLMANEW
jgi:hypothetical protein